MGAAVISGCDAPPVFEPSKHDLDFVPLFIELLTKISWRASAFTRRNTGLNAFGGESAAKLIAIVALVADQRFCAIGQRRVNQFCADMVACLSRCQAHDKRTPHIIDNGMQF